MTCTDKELIAKLREYIPNGDGHDSEFAHTLQAAIAALSRQAAQEGEAVYVSAERVAMLHDDESVVNAYLSRQQTGDDDVALYAAPPDTVPRAELERVQSQYDDLRSFHDASTLEAYELLGIDSADGELRMKWVLLEISKLIKKASELEQFRKDAERYRFLRDDAFENADDCFMEAGRLFSEKNGKGFDEAIDRAMQEGR